MDLTEGIKALALGLPTVFVVLIMIAGIISLTSKLLERLNKIEPEVTPKVSEASKSIPVPETDNRVLVAAIMAAVAATMDVSADDLEIRSFREVQKVTRGNWTIR